MDGGQVVAITSDADKAAALLAFPLARKAWVAGYMGDFEIDTLNGEMDMRLSYVTADLSWDDEPMVFVDIYSVDADGVENWVHGGLAVDAAIPYIINA